MTRRVSRHGTTYTEGSHATPAPGFPNTCENCGQRIYTSRQSFRHNVDDLTGERTAKHIPTCPAVVSQTPTREAA